MVENRMRQLEIALQKMVPEGSFMSIDEILDISSSYKLSGQDDFLKPRNTSSSSVSSSSSSISSAPSILSSDCFPDSSYSSTSSVDSLSHLCSPSPMSSELNDLFSIFDCACSQRAPFATEDVSPSLIASNETINDLSNTPNSSNYDILSPFDTSSFLAVSIYSMAQLFVKNKNDTPSYFISSSLKPLSSDKEYLLVQAYFEDINGFLPIIPNTFLSQYKSGTRRGSWSSLVNIVLALGAWSKQFQNYDLHYYNESKDYLSQDDAECGSLETVAALTLLSLYAHLKFWHSLSSNYLRKAITMAISIGINREPSVKDAFYVIKSELSRRLWWGLVSLDYMYAQVYGQGTLISNDLKTDIGEIRNIEWDALKSRDSVEPSTQISMYSGLIMIKRFHDQFGEPMNSIASSNLSFPEANQLCKNVNLFFQQENSSAGLEASIPGTSQQSRSKFIYSWRSFSFQIMVTQQFLVERISQILAAQKLAGKVVPITVPLTTDEIQCQQLCLLRSIESLENIKKFVESRESSLSLMESREVIDAIYSTLLVPLLFYACYDHLLEDIRSTSYAFAVPSQNNLKQLIESVMNMLQTILPSHTSAVSPVLLLIQTAVDQPITFLSKFGTLLETYYPDMFSSYHMASSLYGSSFGLFEADEMITGEETMEKFSAPLNETIFN